MEECSAVQGEDGDTAVHSCTGSADSFWSCECGHDGDVHEPSDSAACRSALKAECGATDAELDTCHQPGFGTCIPGAGGTWQCACEGEDALEDVAETSCDSALWSHCGESCMRGASNCTPDANGSYDCYCDYYDRSRVIGATNCEEALDRCEPGQGPCATTTGFCDESNEGGFHYECYCLDGSTGTRTPEELGGRRRLLAGPGTGVRHTGVIANSAALDLRVVRRCERRSGRSGVACLRPDRKKGGFSGSFGPVAVG